MGRHDLERTKENRELFADLLALKENVHRLQKIRNPYHVTEYQTDHMCIGRRSGDRRCESSAEAPASWRGNTPAPAKDAKAITRYR